MQTLVVSQWLLLEPLAKSDDQVIFDAIDQNRSFLGRWLPFVPHTRVKSDTAQFIEKVIESRSETFNYVWTIWYKGDFAGVIGYNNTDRVNEKSEIGYWLVENMTGKGIITICAQALISLAFEQMGINRLTIKCAVGNEQSRNVALRLGFQFEGIERCGERYGDQFFDLMVYSLLRFDAPLMAE